MACVSHWEKCNPLWAMYHQSRLGVNFPQAKFDYSFLLKKFRNFTTDEYSTVDENEMAVPPLACAFAKQHHNRHILSVVDEDGYLVLYNTHKTGNEAIIKTWQIHSNAVFDLEWLSEENTILSGSGDQTVVLHDVETQEKVGVFKSHASSVKSISCALSSDAVFSTGSRDGNIMTWDKRISQKDGFIPPVKVIHGAHILRQHQSKTRRRQAPMMVIDGQQSVTCVMYQNQNCLISAGAVDGCLKVWDMRKIHHVGSKGAQPAPVHLLPYAGANSRKHGFSSLVKDHWGHRLFASCTDDVIYEYDIFTYNPEPVHRWTGHRNSSFYVKSALSPDNQFLLSGSSDHMAYIWQVNKPTVSPIVLVSHSAEVTSVTWSPDDVTKLVTLSDDTRTKFWRIFCREQAQEKLPSTLGHAQRIWKERGTSTRDDKSSSLTPLLQILTTVNQMAHLKVNTPKAMTSTPDTPSSSPQTPGGSKPVSLVAWLKRQHLASSGSSPQTNGASGSGFSESRGHPGLNGISNSSPKSVPQEEIDVKEKQGESAEIKSGFGRAQGEMSLQAVSETSPVKRDSARVEGHGSHDQSLSQEVSERSPVKSEPAKPSTTETVMPCPSILEHQFSVPTGTVTPKKAPRSAADRPGPSWQSPRPSPQRLAPSPRSVIASPSKSPARCRLKHIEEDCFVEDPFSAKRSLNSVDGRSPKRPCLRNLTTNGQAEARSVRQSLFNDDKDSPSNSNLAHYSERTDTPDKSSCTSSSALTPTRQPPQSYTSFQQRLSSATSFVNAISPTCPVSFSNQGLSVSIPPPTSMVTEGSPGVKMSTPQKSCHPLDGPVTPVSKASLIKQEADVDNSPTRNLPNLVLDQAEGRLTTPPSRRAKPKPSTPKPDWLTQLRLDKAGKVDAENAVDRSRSPSTRSPKVAKGMNKIHSYFRSSSSPVVAKEGRGDATIKEDKCE